MGMGLGVEIGPGIEQKIIGPLAADDEAFLAVDQEMIPAILGLGRGPEKIRSAARLGQTFGGKDFPSRSGLTYFSFCSSVPCWMMASQTNSAPTPKTQANS